MEEQYNIGTIKYKRVRDNSHSNLQPSHRYQVTFDTDETLKDIQALRIKLEQKIQWTYGRLTVDPPSTLTLTI